MRTVAELDDVTHQLSDARLEPEAVLTTITSISERTQFGTKKLLNGASFTGGTSNCATVNKEVDMATVGFWQNLLKGSYGRVAAGFQYEYIVRKSFDTIPGNGGAVSTNDNVFLTSLRYYPF